jgi:hypothetical protein
LTITEKNFGNGIHDLSFLKISLRPLTKIKNSGYFGRFEHSDLVSAKIFLEIRGVSIFYLRNKKQFHPQLAIIINIIGGVTALFTPP